MHSTILLAAALQRWDRHSAHALAARDVASALAGPKGRLHVLTVYTYERIVAPGLTAEIVARLREDQMQRTDDLMKQKLDEYVLPLADQALEVTRHLRVGLPRETIVEVAREVQADLVVIGSHSKRGLFDVPLGGTAHHVARHAPCTVILVAPRK